MESQIKVFNNIEDLLKERDEIKKKIEILVQTSYMDRSRNLLSSEEIDLQEIQHGIMMSYKKILELRINKLKNNIKQ
jgi:hypothetical protein